MDQLDVNLSELRVALANRQETLTSDLTLGGPPVDDAGENDHAIVLGESAGHPVAAPIEPEPVRSWFQRLFGV